MPIGSGTQFAELPPEVERDLGGLRGGLTFDKAAVRSRRPLLDHERRHHRAGLLQLSAIEAANGKREDGSLAGPARDDAKPVASIG